MRPKPYGGPPMASRDGMAGLRRRHKLRAARERRELQRAAMKQKGNNA